MATATTNTDQPSIIIDRAIQDLVNSFQIQIPDGQSASIRLNEVRLACNELRDGFSFHSEKGRLLVISELTKLNGNCVVKIIRKGLSRLSKLYTGDAKTFEDEAIHFVKLCCLQYSKQIGSEKGKQIASPAIIVDWTVELCDEMMKPRENISLPDTNLSKVPCLVKYLSKLTDLYTSIISERFKIVSNSAPNFTLVEPWRAFFDALKPRIHFESFEELIEETAAIVKTEGILDFMKFSSAGVPKYPILLQLWIELLNFSFVTNWFACETAKHDFLVHDVRYAPSLPFSDKRTYGESLICEICKAISFLTNHPNGQLKLPSDKVKIQVFFDHSEVLLRHTMPCLQLIQSEIETNLIKQIFLILGIKFNQNLLPGITELDTKDCEIALGVFQKMLLSPDQLFIPGLSQAMNVFEVFFLKRLNHMSTSRPHQLASFNAITQALLSLPDKQQVLRVLRIWKENFPDDNSYHMLSELFVLVTVVIQMKRDDISSDIERLISFLLQLTNECLFTLPVWRPLMVNLITSLSHSWDGPDIPDLLRNFAHKSRNLTCSQNENSLEDESVQKINHILNFVQFALKDVSKSDKLKIKALKLGLDLFEDVSQPNEYAFVLNVISSTVSHMETERLKTYTLALLQVVSAHSQRIQYPFIRDVIKLIDNSCCMERKNEVFECYLALLQETNENIVIFITSEFLKLSVNTHSAKLFFSHAAGEKQTTCNFILKCLQFNKGILSEDRINEHVNFLFKLVDKTLSSNRNRCGLFFTTVQNCMQQQLLSFSSIDVFEVTLASMAAGSIGNNLTTEAILKVLYAAVHSHQLDQPIAVISFLIDVTQTFNQTQYFRKKIGYAKFFAEGLCLIARLPLTLQQINRLMNKVVTILDQEKITNDQEVWNVMFHLFQMPKIETTSSIASNDLDSHFEKLLKPSIVRNVAKIPLRSKEVVKTNEVSQAKYTPTFFSLMGLLVDKMPKTFAKGTSASLYQFIVQRVEQNPQLSSAIFPVVEAITKKNVSEAELKEEVEEIEEKLLGVSSAREFISFFGECMRECYIVGLSENQSIKALILHIIECFGRMNLNVEDIHRMTESVLNIPKQLVLSFKDAKDTGEGKKGMERIFDIVGTLDSSVTDDKCLSRLALEPQRHAQLREHIQNDFCLLLKDTTFTVHDVCSALVLYPSLEARDLLGFLDIIRNEELNRVYARFPNTNNQFKLPSPGKLAYLVIQQLRRLGIPDTDVRDSTLKICGKILRNCCLGNLRQMPWGNQCLPHFNPKDYLELLVNIMKQSSYLAEIEHWLNVDCHLAMQFKTVILATCSWKAKSKSCEEALRMNDVVSETLSNLITKKVPPNALVSIGVRLGKEFEVMALVINTYEDEDISFKLFELLCTSTSSSEACMYIISSWDKKESLLLMDKIINMFRERNMEVNPVQFNNEIDIPLKVLPFAAKAFPNSALQLVDFLTKITDKNGGTDDYMSLGRLPVWYKQMTNAGYDSQAIESWCTQLVLSQNLCSSDVDAIANLTPETIKLLSKETNEVGKCLFSLDASETLKTEKESFKRLLLLARLLNEFASIAWQLKEDVKVIQTIKEGAEALCSRFLDDSSSLSILYKIRYNILKELFFVLFGGEDGENKESLTQLTSQGPLSNSLVIVFRRLARSAISRPITFSHVKCIVNTLLNHNVENSSLEYQEIQRTAHQAVLNFESNQDAIHTLQASGYNQSSSIKPEDLWYSSSIQISAYVSTVKSFESSRKESLLRQLWREWKTILSVHGISEVEVRGKMLQKEELFKMSDSLEVMEIQLQFVQQAVRMKTLQQNDWSNYRRRQLLRNEKRLRDKIEEQAKQIKKMTGTKLTKVVIVWENQLLEVVKTCSEKIPDCYAPNGFHSEKPVICGIAIDNRILTLYKEDNGGCRTEMENVEVKLFPAGMLVFGGFSSSHPYDTEQLWAAFYKMLLDKRLVPKIFLSNVSPAFDWIKKFVEPEVSPPRNISFLSCCDLIPVSEDSFDYDLDKEIRGLHTVVANSEIKELIILTPENTKLIKIDNIKPPNRNKLIRQHIDKVVLFLKEDSRLKETHPKSHDKILNRLKFAIRKAVELCIDGDEPTEKSISSSINMEKLLFGCEDAQQKSNVAPYSTIILHAVKTVTGSLQNSRKPYDGCEHVVFVQPNNE